MSSSPRARNRVDQVVADAASRLLDFEAVGEEVENRQPDRRARHPVTCRNAHAVGARSASNIRAACAGCPIASARLMPQACAPPSANGSFEPVGFSPISKNEHRIQLVRQAHRHRHRRGRHFVALADRLVVVADGVGDFGGQALGAGVVAAHQALQLGELADHLGDEVGLGEAGGLFGPICKLSWGGEVLPSPLQGRGSGRGGRRRRRVTAPLPTLSPEGERALRCLLRPASGPA
jgi:hypothetical protein